MRQITLKKSQNREAEWREVYLDDYGHIKALRKGLVTVFLLLIAAFFGCYAISSKIIDFMIADGQKIGFNFVFISPAEILMQQLRMSMLTGLVLVIPFAITFILVYITPAVDGSMLKVIRTILIAVGLFLLGAAFSYFVLIPFMFQMFFDAGVQSGIVAQISVQRYVDIYLALIISIGLVFEIPLLSLLLSKLGILKANMLKKNRYMSLVGILIASCIITPTTDIFSELIVAVPMIVLYEISIAICLFVEKGKEKKIDE